MGVGAQHQFLTWVWWPHASLLRKKESVISRGWTPGNSHLFLPHAGPHLINGKSYPVQLASLRSLILISHCPCPRRGHPISHRDHCLVSSALLPSCSLHVHHVPHSSLRLHRRERLGLYISCALPSSRMFLSSTTISSSPPPLWNPNYLWSIFLHPVQCMSTPWSKATSSRKSSLISSELPVLAPSFSETLATLEGDF